jgi:hypothetical protein
MELQRDFGGSVGTQHDRRRFSAGKFIALTRDELARRLGRWWQILDRRSSYLTARKYSVCSWLLIGKAISVIPFASDVVVL